VSLQIELRAERLIAPRAPEGLDNVAVGMSREVLLRLESFPTPRMPTDEGGCRLVNPAMASQLSRVRETHATCWAGERPVVIVPSKMPQVPQPSELRLVLGTGRLLLDQVCNLYPPHRPCVYVRVRGSLAPARRTGNGSEHPQNSPFLGPLQNRVPSCNSYIRTFNWRPFLPHCTVCSVGVVALHAVTLRSILRNMQCSCSSGPSTLHYNLPNMHSDTVF
jgi:hypothetical protein